MQVKCDYCGSWMEDTQEFCPNCSAANANLARVAVTTPKTIAQLIDWYKARNLPPFETTRFFIGENYKGAKAFGIYEENGEFIVYKNKADGSRAVRYRGTDEAYAVNEIYLRLKEEILNQKNVNQQRKNAGSRSSVSGATYSSTSAGSDLKSEVKGCGPGCLKVFLIAIAVMFGLAGLGAIIGKIDEARARTNSYYMSDDRQTVYYYGGYSGFIGLENTNYEWWVCDVDDFEWSLCDVETDRNNFPASLDKDNICGDYGSLSDLLDELGVEYGNATIDVNSKYNVQSSMAYKDCHHSSPYESAYYFVDGQSYYHLYDSHSSYGDGDNHTGWYIFDDEWEYYCSDDDHSTLGDDLWYDYDKYKIDDNYSGYQAYISGNVYNFSSTEAAEWNSSSMASDFADTTWYSNKLYNDAAYEKYWDERSASSSSKSGSDSSSSWDWSSDSSWDWDSSDSWDSGSTDWDSDW